MINAKVAQRTKLSFLEEENRLCSSDDEELFKTKAADKTLLVPLVEPSINVKGIIQ